MLGYNVRAHIVRGLNVRGHNIRGHNVQGHNIRERIVPVPCFWLVKDFALVIDYPLKANMPCHNHPTVKKVYTLIFEFYCTWELRTSSAYHSTPFPMHTVTTLKNSMSVQWDQHFPHFWGGLLLSGFLGTVGSENESKLFSLRQLSCLKFLALSWNRRFSG